MCAHSGAVAKEFVPGWFHVSCPDCKLRVSACFRLGCKGLGCAKAHEWAKEPWVQEARFREPGFRL